jgi:hypothetical protein
MGRSVLVQLGVIYSTAMSVALCQAREKECLSRSRVSLTLATYEYSLVKKSLAAFAIVQKRYQESPLAHPMSSMQMKRHCPLFTVERQLEPAIRLSDTAYL